MNEIYKQELLRIINERSLVKIEISRVDTLVKKVKALIFCESYTWIDLEWIHSNQNSWFQDIIDWIFEEFLFLKTTKEKVEFLTNAYTEISIIHRTESPTPYKNEWNLTIIDFEKARTDSLNADYICLVWTICWAYKRWTLDL